MLNDLDQNSFFEILTNIQDSSPEETEEVLSAIDSLSDDDLAVNSVKTITV